MIPTIPTSSMTIGRVASVVHDGTAVIDIGLEALNCVVLESAVLRAPLDVDDVVVVLRPGSGDEAGVVLGRVADSNTCKPIQQRPDTAEASQEKPAVLHLEATEELVLRVGDGSITIRKDGKILIKGKDLVSHAQRVNRIKGGSVSIN